MYRANLLHVLQGGQDFVITNEDYNGNLEAGEDLCLKFTARTHATDLPKVYFYVEGVDNPVDVFGVTHPRPATTMGPLLARGGKWECFFFFLLHTPEAVEELPGFARLVVK